MCQFEFLLELFCVHFVCSSCMFFSGASFFSQSDCAEFSGDSHLTSWMSVHMWLWVIVFYVSVLELWWNMTCTEFNCLLYLAELGYAPNCQSETWTMEINTFYCWTWMSFVQELKNIVQLHTENWFRIRPKYLFASCKIYHKLSSTQDFRSLAIGLTSFTTQQF